METMKLRLRNKLMKMISTLLQIFTFLLLHILKKISFPSLPVLTANSWILVKKKNWFQILFGNQHPMIINKNDIRGLFDFYLI